MTFFWAAFLMFFMVVFAFFLIVVMIKGIKELFEFWND